MEFYRLGWPWSWLYNLAGRLSGRPGRTVQVYRGGSTAVFAARLPRPGRAPRRDGVLVLRFKWAEAFAALKVTALILASIGMMAALISSSRSKNLFRR